MEFATITSIGALLPGVLCVGACALCMRMMSRGNRADTSSTCDPCQPTAKAPPRTADSDRGSQANPEEDSISDSAN